MLADPPFVLLDDARRDGAPARLYARPLEIVRADTGAEVPAVLERLREGTRAGLHAAGFLAYEAGEAFEPAVGALPPPEGPLAWFGLFERYDTVADVPARLPDPAGAWIGALEPEIDRDTYDTQLAQVLRLIEAGDIYQANLTFRARIAVAGNPLALYARLRAASRAGWGAVVHTGEDILLSLSPELFVSLDQDTLTCRPMKGTATRRDDPAEDRAAARTLAADEKQRAENLMIVDLMRNDLARVAVPGSVAVPDLFAVERYPTVHQMTSTVTATLLPDRDTVDVLAALFPCGSITGAPKVRAMQAIAAIERSPRGAYCGSIGRIDANGNAQFNVAIRTLTIRDGDAHATLGLGSGIVADSRADDEWAECLAKGAFLQAGARPFDLIETMAFDPEEGLPLLERHLARMRASADGFGYPFDRHAARNELQAATFRLRGGRRIRLLLASTGAISIEVSPLPPAPVEPVPIRVVPLPVDPADIRLRHKTGDRAFYDRARLEEGGANAFEVVFEAPDGSLSEGSFTSLFVERDGVLITPAGPLLPGVLRAELLATGRAREGVLTRADLAGNVFVGNALRGLIAAVVAD